MEIIIADLESNWGVFVFGAVLFGIALYYLNKDIR